MPASVVVQRLGLALFPGRYLSLPPLRQEGGATGPEFRGIGFAPWGQILIGQFPSLAARVVGYCIGRKSHSQKSESHSHQQANPLLLTLQVVLTSPRGQSIPYSDF